METFTTLLGGAIVHVLRDEHPVLRAMFVYELEEQLIFFGDPLSTTVEGKHGGGESRETYTRYTTIEGMHRGYRKELYHVVRNWKVDMDDAEWLRRK